MLEDIRGMWGCAHWLLKGMYLVAVVGAIALLGYFLRLLLQDPVGFVATGFLFGVGGYALSASGVGKELADIYRRRK